MIDLSYSSRHPAGLSCAWQTCLSLDHVRAESKCVAVLPAKCGESLRRKLNRDDIAQKLPSPWNSRNVQLQVSRVRGKALADQQHFCAVSSQITSQGKIFVPHLLGVYPDSNAQAGPDNLLRTVAE